jgi:hypothetical protein
MDKLKQIIDQELEASKEVYNKAFVMYMVSRDVLTNLWNALRYIAAQESVRIVKNKPPEDLPVLEPEEPPQTAELDQIINEGSSEGGGFAPQPGPHKMIGSANPNILPRLANTEELDPKNFPFEIPEEKIRFAHMHTGGFNAYTQLLLTADVFRSANLEPIFLTNKDESIIRVAVRETWLKPNTIN